MSDYYDDVDMISETLYTSVPQSSSLPRPQSGPTDGVHLSAQLNPPALGRLQLH